MVKINYEKTGYADITLKDLKNEIVYQEKIFGDFWWDNVHHYRPHWGLYRLKDEHQNGTDYQSFQNIQIWKN